MSMISITQREWYQTFFFPILNVLNIWGMAREILQSEFLKNSVRWVLTSLFISGIQNKILKEVLLSTRYIISSHWESKKYVINEISAIFI